MEVAMDFKHYGFDVKKVGEYTYNYQYGETTVTHHMQEYYQDADDTRVVLLEKETRKQDNFIRLPQTIFISRRGYPPLATDAALQQLNEKRMTLYFAGLPTVQSEEHIRIFDQAMTEELRELGLDYAQASAMIKSGKLFNNITITGFVTTKQGGHDLDFISAMRDKVLASYVKVLAAPPRQCPVEQWGELLMGPQADFEYHLFKKWGFDVPLSAQKAFFTMMSGPRSCYLTSNEALAKLQGVGNL